MRRKGHPTQTLTFPTKTAANRMDRELADQEARGVTPGEEITIGELIDWRINEPASIRAISKTHSGNMTRIREGLGDIVARTLPANDVIEHTRRRIRGDHMMANGVIIPACVPATMNVELGFLSELLKLATDPVAKARPVLRLLRLVGRPKRRDRRPTADELQRLREHLRAAAWRSTIPMVDIIDFAVLTAKRESEITRLLWSDVDQTKRTALLRDAKHPGRRRGTISSSFSWARHGTSCSASPSPSPSPSQRRMGRSSPTTQIQWVPLLPAPARSCGSKTCFPRPAT